MEDGAFLLSVGMRELKKKCIAVLITSDKSYKNLEIQRGYKESDILDDIEDDNINDILEDGSDVEYIDKDNIAYYGWSWGGRLGGIMVAIENRFKTALLISLAFRLN